MHEEIDRLAHSLALETSISAVECAAVAHREGDVEWLELDRQDAKMVRGEIQYLEMRGAIERHPSRRNWLRIVQAGAVE